MIAGTNFPPARIEQIKGDPEVMGMVGDLSGLSVPGPQHRELHDMVKEAEAEVGAKDVHLLVHRGSILGTAYLPKYDVLLVNERFPQVVLPIECKAILAHEIDHKEKRGLVTKAVTAVTKLAGEDGGRLQDARAVLFRFLTFLEFAADARSAKTYGAEHMYNGLQKVMVACAMEDDRIKAYLFPERRIEEYHTLTEDEIRNRVTGIADGTFEPLDKGDVLAERFKRLRNFAPSWER